MIRHNLPLFALLAVLTVSSAQAQDDAKLAAQKKAAADNWTKVEAGEPAHLETDHFLIHAAKPLEGQLKDVGAMLEKYYTTAAKALQVKEPKELWPGKLAVFLFDDREDYNTFVRRVERRRMERDESSSHRVEGDFPHASAAPSAAAGGPGIGQQAAEEAAAAILQRKAGNQVILPGWLMLGFGRATTWRVSPREAPTAKARAQAIDLVLTQKRSARAVWNGELTPEESLVLSPSLADMLAYGPGANRFPSFVTGFRPEEGQERRSTDQAMEAAGIVPANVEKHWPSFVRYLR
jgi:hypothetical protein